MILNLIKRNTFHATHFNSLSFLYGSLNLVTDHRSISKVLSACFKSGKTREAENLFDKIPHKNIVLWSILIHGFAINGFHRKSVELFSQMRVSGFIPNSFTVVGVLVGVQGLGDVEQAQSVHGIVLKSGFESDLIVATTLLNTYSKCGNVRTSFKLFLGMENPGPISYNAMISSLITNNLAEEGLSLFNRFRKSGFAPNASTLLTIAHGCSALESRTICESVHGLVAKLGFDLDISVNNSILGMYSSVSELNSAIMLFDGMKDRDVISWTTIMNLLLHHEFALASIDIFVRMRDSMVNYDSVVIMSLVSACTLLANLNAGKQIHCHAVVCGFESEIALVNSLITMYSKCKDLSSSKKLFNQMHWRSLVSWTAMVSGLLQNGYPREAFNLLKELRLENNYMLDLIIVLNAITASGEVAELELCLQLHCYSIVSGAHHNISLQNSLISAYSKCGIMDLAYNVFKDMGLLRNIIGWNAVINGYGINGQGEISLALYKEMRKHGEVPDSGTYLSVLSACSHTGLIKEGLMIFSEMVEDVKVIPKHEHYGCIVDMLSRGGSLSEASEFLEVTSRNAMRSLLNSCLLHNKTEIAEVVAKKLFQLDPGETGQIVMLSNVYASVGRFKEAGALRISMQERGLMKNPGISLLAESR